jgi:hypothetical protein
MAPIENTFFTSAYILILYEEDAIRVADIEKVELINLQKKALLENCKDNYGSDGSYETHITILY